MIRSSLERRHGAPINFKTLTSCGRPLYARSGLNAPQNIPDPYRRGYGNWWLVTFCDDAGSPSVSIAISALANDLTIQGGSLHFPWISGNEFVAVGVPLGHVGEYPMAPETAVEMVAQQAGKRIASVPELITPLSSDGPPQLARWRLTFEGPVTVRTNHGQRTTNEVFAGPAYVGGSVVTTSVVAPEQPPTIDLNWMPLPTAGERQSAYLARAINQTTKIPRRVDTPVRVEPISAWGN
jgi:hypothetical protein